MKQDVKDQWVAALRSGEWEQTQSTLREGDSYCCLGVLCELAVRDGVAVKRKLIGPAEVGMYSYAEEGMYSYDLETDTLPPSVRAWAGLEGACGNNPSTTEVRDGVGDPVSVAELNDSGFTFEQIADVIERDI